MSELEYPALRGARVTLRPLTPSDRTAFLSAVAASRGLHGEWVSPPKDEPAYHAYLARAGSTFIPLAVEINDTGELAGAIAISEVVRRAFQSGYLGYFAFEPHAKKGYMREGMALVLEFAFNHIDLHRLEANIRPENTASIALVRSLGFVREGYSEAYLFLHGAWRDHERWAIRKELWSSVERPVLTP